MVMGPTAVGKTDLSFFLAGKLGAGILNCDSVQMFKELNIGSAKKTSFTSAEKKVPLFLFDEFTAPSICTAGLFRRKAFKVLQTELKKQPIIAVGGSGFYIKAIETGMFKVKAVPKAITEKLQLLQKTKGLAYLYSMLKKKDPSYAKKISSKDSYRILRGLSLILSENKTMSVIAGSFKKQKPLWPVIKIGLSLPKEKLLKNVKTRTQKMLKEGLLDEVQNLIDKGFADWPLMKSVGYKECADYLKGRIKKEDLQEAIVTRTMRLAKKQNTWLRQDKDIIWHDKSQANNTDILKLFINLKFQSCLGRWYK